MLNSPLPMYVKHFGADNTVAGLVTGLFSLSALICRPIFGNLLDRKGRKLILLFGIAIYSIIVFSYNWAASVIVLLSLRFLQGIGMSGYTTASGTVAADLIPAKRLVEGFSYYGMIQPVATAIGPMLGLTLVAGSSYPLLFDLSFLLGIAGLAAVFFINYERDDTQQVYIKKESANGRRENAIIERTAIPVASMMFFISFTTGTVMTFLPVYALACGIKSIGIYFTINAAAVFLSRTFTTGLSEKFGLPRVLTAGIALLASSMVLLSFSDSLRYFLIAAVLNGFGNGILNPVLNSLLIRFCPKERRGAANGTYFSAIDIGIGAGAVIGGSVSQTVGYAFLYLISALSAVFAFMVFYFAIRRRITETR